MKREIAVILWVISIVLLSACGSNTVSLETLDSSDSLTTTEASSFVTTEDVFVTEGTEEYRGFILDNVLHSEKDGEIHYNPYLTVMMERSLMRYFLLCQDMGDCIFKG